MALCAKGRAKVLPIDRSVKFPGYACLLGNVMETAALIFAQPDCSFDLAMDFAVVAASLLEELSPIQTSNTGSKEIMHSKWDEDEMIMDEEFKEKVLNKDLERHISNAIDPRFFLQLVKASVITTEASQVPKGIVDLLTKHSIRKLVM